MDHTAQRVLHDTVKPKKASVSSGSASGRAMWPGFAQAHLT